MYGQQRTDGFPGSPVVSIPGRDVSRHLTAVLPFTRASNIAPRVAFTRAFNAALAIATTVVRFSNFPLLIPVHKDRSA